MNEDKPPQSAKSMTAEARRQEGPMAMCPMAKMCAGMTQGRFSGIATMLPGILLIALGVLIVVAPSVLVWLVAAASVLLGIMLLMVGGFIRNMGRRLRM